MTRVGRRSPSPEAQERRLALGDVIREARGEASQTELGRRLEPILGSPVPQTTISRWELGLIELTLEQARAIELALGLAPGWLAQQAGYI